MNSWAVQDAKSQFSRVIDLAQTKGPQTITRHGKPVAVLISTKEFKSARKPKETPLEFFSRFRGLHIPERSKDLPRKIDL
jgi:antitoxin Phd